MGADLIVVQSSTSTFQQSGAPQQHASLAAVRAVETGRSVVHATLTGDSAVFDPTGRELAWLGTSQTGSYVVRVPITAGTTFYVRHGDWVPDLSLVVLLAASTLLAGRAVAARHRNRTVATPPGGTANAPAGRPTGARTTPPSIPARRLWSARTPARSARR